MILWAVIAGGQGVRYGQPKVSAMHGGRTFLETMLSVVDAARSPGDHVAIGVAHDTDCIAAEDRIIVRDLTVAPGPAHSIARLSEHAKRIGGDLVFMPVDMLAVTPMSLTRLSQRLAENRRKSRDAVVVARSADRVHWVLGAVPLSLLGRVVTAAESVSAVQSLLRLCPLDYLDVPEEELLDVNTRDSLPDGYR